MTKEEILGGLRNAMDRGENPQDAAQSFLNAGYAEKDVMEALGNLTSESPNALEIPRRILLTERQNSTQDSGQADQGIKPSAPGPAREVPSLPKIEVKKEANMLLWAIGAVGAILLGVIAALLLNLRSS